MKRAARMLPLAAAVLLGACALPPQIEPGAATAPAPAPAAIPPQAQQPAQPPASPADIQRLQDLVSQQDRLYRVAAPLLINNSELCRSHARALLGFRAKNRFSYSAELSSAAHHLLGLDERLRVTGVIPNSGAARAGIQVGDVLLAVEGKAFPEGEQAESQAATLLAPLVAEKKVLKLTVLRAQDQLALDVPLTPACAFNIEVGNTDLVNAYGDGFRVLLTRGMLNTLRNDDEVAYVLAREMAHNVLGHAARMNQQAAVGGIIDNLARLQPDMSTMTGMAGLRPVSPDFDSAADRLAIYLLARAGYNIERAAPFWRRFTAQHPVSAQNAYSALHPAIERRIGGIEQAVRDIRNRRANGRPLIPAP
ncbi:MAG TPA: M48 family metallopeptidase [Noviherbaspirillum sp.]|nr:M48 family metallopeptidase [Noviherbaspirillum sp.]